MKLPPFAPIPAGLPASVPFIDPETLERRQGRAFAARLGANENGFGPSPKAVRAMQEEAAQVWKYGDSASYELTTALAERLLMRPGNIIVGEGIDGLLGLLVRLLIAPGDGVVTSDGAYPTFNYHVTGFGGLLHKVPYRDDHEDPQALLDLARRTGARMIYLANPDNPMGSWHRAGVIRDMIENLPQGCLLVLDEAYIEYAPRDAVPDIAADDPRVIRMRTFSKAYALAGARIGYAIGHPDLIAGFDRIRNHFGIGRIAQAGALAALQDDDWLAQIRVWMAAARARIARIGTDNGLQPLPSAAGFVALDTGRDADFAARLVHELGVEGVFVRMPGTAPLNRCIRISGGPDPDLDALATALPRALARL